jgi:Ser/Thr protein kinase RdoA (MazF antagonist)
MTSTALDSARQRIADRPAPERITGHLQARYGVTVTGVAQLDLGVYRVERADEPAWVARVLPQARAGPAAAGDAEILEFVARHGFPAERVAASEPLSVLDGHQVLVTEFVPTVPAQQRARAIRDDGGLRRLGELLGELRGLPADHGATARPGGAWHHLADGSPEDEIQAMLTLLGECAAAAAAGQPHYEMLARELADADDGAGLPTALIHPDFVLANVIASAERGMVLVDWAGAGRGPRTWPLAFLLYAEGAKNPPRADLVVAGYRRRVTLEPEEIERIPDMMLVRPLVLAAWSFCLGRSSGTQAARAVASTRRVAQTVGPRVVAAFRAPRS